MVNAGSTSHCNLSKFDRFMYSRLYRWQSVGADGMALKSGRKEMCLYIIRIWSKCPIVRNILGRDAAEAVSCK